MPNLITKLRNWWWQPYTDQACRISAELKSVADHTAQLNAQIDFLKFEVSAYLPEDRWRKILETVGK